MEQKTSPDKPGEKKFKSFNETYALCAFGLALGLIYPNRAKLRKRVALGIFIISLNFAELFWFVNYIIVCLQRGDIYNLMRNMSLAVVTTLFFFKSIYANYKNDDFGALLQKMSKDLLKGNEVEEDYQEIYEEYIRLGKIGQTCWTIIPIIFSSQFPLYSGVANIYESMKSDVGPKHMQHDMELKFLENKQYETPWFEIVFAFNFFQCFILAPNFAGFDGSFCIATTHLRMKLKLMVHKLKRAFKDSRTDIELQRNVKEAIKDHQEALEFYNDIQEVYGCWLLAVFLLTSGLISFNLYQMYLVQRVDPKYTIFVLSGVMHMFAPCYFAADLLQMSETLCCEIYDVPWESRGDTVVTQLLIFMIAKAQQPLILTGLGMVIFNMQLFISIMQTSYSFFTLITS